MHLYIAIRGVKNRVDEIIKHLEAVWLPVKYKMPNDKEPQDYQIQLQVRPIQLYEIVYPAEHRDLMLNTIMQGKPIGKTNYPKLEKFVWAVRKFLGLKDVEEYKKERILPMTALIRDVEIIGIGEKDDYWTTPDGVNHQDKQPDASEGL